MQVVQERRMRQRYQCYPNVVIPYPTPIVVSGMRDLIDAHSYSLCMTNTTCPLVAPAYITNDNHVNRNNTNFQGTNVPGVTQNTLVCARSTIIIRYYFISCDE